MMTDLPPLQKIISVEARQDYRLLLTWENGRTGIVDLSDMIRRGGVFAALSDTRKFAGVRVGEGNRVIEWPDANDALGEQAIEIDSMALACKAAEQLQASLCSS